MAEAVRLGARRARLAPVAAPALPVATVSREDERPELGLSPDDLMVLTVSRLAPQKNLAMLADVAAGVRDRADLQFVMVGEGPERPALERRIADDGLAVRLLGHRDDAGLAAAAADLALLTSTWEARALVAQEALLSGLPLISTRVGGIEELVGDAAVLVEPGDAAGAARRLIAGWPTTRRSGPGWPRRACGRRPAGRTRTRWSRICSPATRPSGRGR